MVGVFARKDSRASSFGEGIIIQVSSFTGALGYYKFTENPAVLNVRKNYVDQLENNLIFFKEPLAFLLCVTVLHEYVHFGTHVNGISEGAYDFGSQGFEKEAFNVIVGTDNINKIYINFKEFFEL